MTWSESDMENCICPCGKKYKDFERCPICGEKTCLDCDDYEAYHRQKEIEKMTGSPWSEY